MSEAESAKTSVVNVRVDREVKDGAVKVLADHGISVSDAVRILLTRIVKDNRVPPFMFMDEKAYDEWFRAKVRAALDDDREEVPHEEAMAGIRARLREKSAGAAE